MEPAFNTYSITKKWVDGYQSVSYRFRLYNVGSADGCPLNYPPDVSSGYFPPGGCNNNWNQDQIYYISWGAGTWFLPEIYESVNEAHSQQWYSIGLYASLSRSNKMTFEGTLTQRGACQQLLDEGDITGWQLWCNTLDNRPEDAFTELHYWLTAYNLYEHLTNSMKWPTDIRNYEGP